MKRRNSAVIYGISLNNLHICGASIADSSGGSESPAIIRLCNINNKPELDAELYPDCDIEWRLRGAHLLQNSSLK